MTTEFIHLRYRSPYSVLEGALTMKKAADQCKREFMPALGISDINNMCGALEFSETLVKNGVQPVIGSTIEIDNGHLVFYCQNRNGYENLMHLSSEFYLGKLDIDEIGKHSDDIICLTGGKNGVINNLISTGRVSDAEKYIESLYQIFDDRLYIEIQRHFGNESSVESALLNIAYDKNIKIVATNDVYFLNKEDHESHDALLCIKNSTYVLEPDREKISNQHYFKTQKEMVELFMDLPEAVEATHEIASRCSYFPVESNPILPKFSDDEKGLLYEQTKSGLYEKILDTDALDIKQYMERLEYELEVISNMGFSGYFLIVADFIQWSKDNDIPVGPGRGSGAGSIVAWALGITDLDPIRYGLLFERFLNPDRVSMPDFDIDFCQDRRGEVIEYVKNKYGADKVAQIITFGTLQPKAAIRDIGRVLQMPLGQVDRISKLIPNNPNNPMTLAQSINIEPELQKMQAEQSSVKKLFQIASKVEGLYRNTSTHAAGIVIGDRPLEKLVPLYKDEDSDISATQFPMKYAEKAGLVKFDFLGLKTLTVIDKCKKHLLKRGIEIDFDKIDRSDAKTYELLKSGRSLGVFQLESSGMRDVLRNLKPDTMEELSALIALYRPGPMQYIPDYIDRKFGKGNIEYYDECLMGILAPTYGVIVYQEQVMEISQVFSGFTLARADILRRGVGKKNREEIESQKEAFIEGAVKLGRDRSVAQKIFSDIEEFANYSFNKCLHKDSLITDFDSGLQHRIEDIFIKKMSFRTLSLSKDGKLIPKIISNSYSNGTKDVYEIITKSGRKIKSTETHKYLKYEGWSELSELSVGDMIATPRTLSVNHKDDVDTDDKWPYHKLVSLGWILSEGNTCHPSSIYYFNNDMIEVDDFCKHVSMIENTDYTITQQGGRKTYTVSTKKLSGDSNRGLSGVYSWIRDLGLTYKTATQKFIPPEIFSLSDRKISIMLGRMWAGDGHIHGKTGPCPYYATSSYQIAKDVRRCLLRLGIQSSLNFKKFKYRDGVKDGYAVVLKGDSSFSVFYEKVCPHVTGKGTQVSDFKSYIDSIDLDRNSSDFIPKEVAYKIRDIKQKSGLSWSNFERFIGKSTKEICSLGVKKRGFRRSTIRHIANICENDELLKESNSDIFWDTIREINYIGKSETYDITVDDNHNYIADGFIVHNSHSVAYAYIGFQTAYLKAHYPVEFLCACMSLDKSNTDKLSLFFKECKELDVEVVDPCINTSVSDFDVRDGKIYYSLSAIKGAGEEVMKIIEDERKNGTFKDLNDFCRRVNLAKVNKKSVESLTKSGCLDSLGETRSTIINNFQILKKVSKKKHDDDASSQMSMFADDDVLAINKTEEYDEDKILSDELASFGFYMKGHPLDGFIDDPMSSNISLSSEFKDMLESSNKNIKCCGVVMKKDEMISKSKSKFAYVTMSDPSGQYNFLIWERDLDKYRDILVKGNKVTIRGALSHKNGEVSLSVQKIEEI